MNCPFCNATETKVIDSRLAAEGDAIRRRRTCCQCERRFTTYERYDDIMPFVVKKDGQREAFDRKKVMSGLQKACEKRPVSFEQINEVVNVIERKVREQDSKEVNVSVIGELIMDALKSLDDVAYVRFASVYRSFRDVNEFLNEIQGLLKT